MTTAQQASLALGVATLGTLFVTLAPAARLGTLHATAVVVGIQAVVTARLAWGAVVCRARGERERSPTGSEKLPRPGRAAHSGRERRPWPPRRPGGDATAGEPARASGGESGKNGRAPRRRRLLDRVAPTPAEGS